MDLSELKNKEFDDLKNNNNYPLFKNNMGKHIDFFSSLSYLINDCGHSITYISNNKVYFLNTLLIDSSVKTLINIEFCCSNGSFSDANALVRKFRDDLMLFLYIMDIVNNIKYLNEEQINSIIGDEMNVEKFIKIIKLSTIKARDDSFKNDDEKCVDAWFQNSVSQLTKQQKKKLNFENYMNHLKKNASINEIISKYDLKINWESIRTKLNDYVHNNGLTFTQQNLITVGSEDIKKYFDEITSRLDFISAFFMVLLMLVNSTLISSTDYIDHVDCGLTPPDDCQYYVAPFIQNFIYDYINKINPELKVFLKNNNSYGMFIN